MDYKQANWVKSPNYWIGRTTSIREIAIHHWGSPTAGYTHFGVVNTFKNPARQASAHYVISAAKVTQMVREADTSWATGNANPWTVSLEIDPKCELRATASQRALSDTIYQQAGKVIADIRKRHGEIPLVPHRKYQATACPGIISLTKLDQYAREETSIMTKARVKYLYNKYFGRDPYDPEYGKWVGKPERELLASMTAYWANQSKSLRDDLAAVRSDLKKALSDLSTRPTKAELQKALDRVAEVEATLKELQEKQEQEEQAAQTFMSGFVAWIKSLKFWGDN